MDNPPGGEKSRRAANYKLPIRSSVLRFVVGCALLQDINELTACARYVSIMAPNDILGPDRVAIYVCTSVIVRTDG